MSATAPHIARRNRQDACRATESRIALCILMMALVAWLEWIRRANIPVVDDSAISFAFARTWAEGHGFRLTPYSTTVEGFSNPVWTMVLGIAFRCGLAFPFSAQLLGVLGSIIGWLCISFVRPLSQNDRLRIPDALAAALVLLSPSFAYWAMGGLENGSVTLMIGISSVLAFRNPGRQSGVALGFALGVLGLTRPESVLYASAIGAVALVAARHRPDFSRFALHTALAGVLVIGAWSLFRWVHFASVLPNTYYLKFGANHDGWPYLREAAQYHAPLLALAALGVAVSVAGGTVRLGTLLTLLVGSAAMFFVVRSGGDWMREFRFLAHLWPLVAIPIADAADLARVHSSFRARRMSRVLWLGVIFGAGCFQYSISSERSEDMVRAPTFPWSFVTSYVERVRGVARELRLAHPRIVVTDIGGFGTDFREAQLVDALGLADWPVGRGVRLNQDYVIDYLVEEVPPTIVESHGPSSYLARHPRFAELYEPSGPRFARYDVGTLWIYRGVSPTHDPRCPEPLAAISEWTAGDMSAALEAALDHDDPARALRLYRCFRERRETRDLPTRESLDQIGARAMERAHSLTRDARDALRFASLATVLRGERAHDRRFTEFLRRRLYHGRW